MGTQECRPTAECLTAGHGSIYFDIVEEKMFFKTHNGQWEGKIPGALGTNKIWCELLPACQMIQTEKWQNYRQITMNHYLYTIHSKGRNHSSEILYCPYKFSSIIYNCFELVQ
jgi:hypothetical protein